MTAPESHSAELRRSAGLMTPWEQEQEELTHED